MVTYSIKEVEAVVLQTDGSFSVIKKSKTDSRYALSDVPSLDAVKINLNSEN